MCNFIKDLNKFIQSDPNINCAELSFGAHSMEYASDGWFWWTTWQLFTYKPI